MRATPLLLGCVIFMGGTANGVAAEVNVSDNAVAGAQHMASDGSSHETATSGDDVADLNRHRASAASSSSNPAIRRNSSSNNDDNAGRIGDGSSAPPTHPASLGWQSLLPGSIQ